MSGPGSVIAAVETRLLLVPLPPFMHGFGYREVNVPFVTIRDADGRSATGFCYSLDLGTRVVCDMIDRVVGPALLGRSPAEWDEVSAAVAAGTRRLGATSFTAAVSAVDIAIWDLRAQLAEAPLAALLGGVGIGVGGVGAGGIGMGIGEPVPFYGSGRGGQLFELDELVAQSLGYAAEGYAGVKLAVGALAPETDAARVAAVRDALDPAIPVMVDASERLSLPEALALGRRLDQLDVLWFEEPLPAEDVDGYRILASTLATPVATGEHFQQLELTARYLRETAIGYLQPDAALGGGITRMLRTAALAEAFHRPLAWHSLADLHVHLAALPGTAFIEDFPILDGIIADPLRPQGGRAVPPERPGHGIRWDDAAIERCTVASERLATSAGAMR